MPPGEDAAVLRVKGTRKAIALTTDGNGRYCYLDPYLGGAIAVAEAARNLVCTGAEPLALTDCLNLGNPERAEIYYQLEQSIGGMASACSALNIPVISGNVSLYNETKGEAVYPTPVVGMVGLIEDIDRRCTMRFKHDGDIVVLLGEGESGLGGSEYLELIHDKVAGNPGIDLELEKRVQRCCLDAIRQGLLSSAHDCSDGGLAIALAECCIAGEVGFQGRIGVENRLDAALFGEGQSRIVASIKPALLEKLKRLAAGHKVKLEGLGVVEGKRFILEGVVDLPLKEAEKAWRGGLEGALGFGFSRK
jgi:phosphoribosylformylglycinamidine synthase